MALKAIFPILELSNQHVVVVLPDKRHANRTDLCKSGRTADQQEHRGPYERRIKRSSASLFIWRSLSESDDGN